MGNVVAFARRNKGDTWWIGVVNGADEREIKITLEFPNKKTKASLIYDGVTNTSVDRREQTVTKQECNNTG
ncbi:glycoside hydrolase family 97 C-terminal domain-containing protein [Mucilaginibacter gracilis]|uniref:glycoside hydrolase family 97 C-terminal domain-containing protein n=1 Tax=Mucilaginibacter gracilis TaxID=423350 RepID=UPI001FE68489|nr:glycoside hydrolase family 97 C-terminal domain-containing protein [Mucilaginibacter gracilis]